MPLPAERLEEGHPNPWSCREAHQVDHARDRDCDQVDLRCRSGQPAGPAVSANLLPLRQAAFGENADTFTGPYGGPRGAQSGKLAIWGCWDDPAIGAISALRQQMRTDVKVYGENGNAQAIAAIQKGFMEVTAWQNSEQEGVTLVDTVADAIAAGKSWQPKAVEVPPVVVTSATVADFIKEHPDALGK